jgi:peptidylprolyl isomerase
MNWIWRVLVVAALLLHVDPSWARGAPQAPDWRRADPDNVLILTTSRGQVVVEIAPEAAPQTAAHIKALVRAGFYDNSIFYRVLPGFVAQTGDRGERRFSSGAPGLPDEFLLPPGLVPPPPPPLGDPAPAPPRFIGALPVARPDGQRPGQAWTAFCPGVAGLAHDDRPNSGESQIFFMTVHAQNLEATFTAWGRVVIGMDVLAGLSPGEPPATPDRVITARLASDLPADQRPVLEVLDPAGPTAMRQIRELVRARNMSAGACDVSLTARLLPPAPATGPSPRTAP